MWMKDGVLGGIEFSSLPLWAWAGLCIATTFSCFRKEREENDHGINRLPDDILGDIVSRLEATEASRTSILSKRWRKIWTMDHVLGFFCLDTLDIDYDCHLNIPYGDKQRFFKAVNQCLKACSGCKLKIFGVYCCFLEGRTCHLVRWMQSIARLDVEELYLGQSCCTDWSEELHRKFTFSFKLINGLSRLKKLYLMCCKVETSFVSQCNSLVSITLRYVPLDKLELSDIILSCPNLKILVLEGCKYPERLRISGLNLKLETLEFDGGWNLKKFDISDCNLVTILMNIHLEVEISMSSLPKLETLYLQTCGIDYCFGDVSRDLPQLKFLSIQAQEQQQILWLPSTFKVFGNVRILYLLTKCYGDVITSKVDLWNFAPVLTACPLLEEFYLMVGGPYCKGERKERRNALRHKHLQHMEFSGFSNAQEELEFAKFILTSAEVLRLLLLKPSFRQCDGMCSSFEGEKDFIIHGDAQVACANLQSHAISMRARVEIC